VTTVRDLGDRGYRTVAARDRRTPGLPRIVAAGPPITPPDGHCHYLGGAASGPEELRAAVVERRDRGVDVVKVMVSGGMLTAGTDMFGVQFPLDDLRLLVDACHDADLGVLAHAHSLAGIEQALAVGVDGIEHFSGLTEAGVRVPDDVLDLVAAGGVVVDPTLGFDRAGFAAMPTLPPGAVEAMRRTGLDFESFHAARLAVVARLRERGLRVVTGLDAGASPLKPHGKIGLAIADLVDAGYPLDEALSTATSVAADACRLGQVTGSLRAGLAADLLVLADDLRDGPDALGSPCAVMVDGIEAALT
jgi:imidazolonepropionase-like amidohydrolase